MKTEQISTWNWQVEPYLTPDSDSDPLGVYKVEPFYSRLNAAMEATEDEGEIELIHTENRNRASLIAAAPDLLAALKAVQQDRHDIGEVTDDTDALICAAIAKAKGETP